eukprot:gene34960-54711_t
MGLAEYAEALSVSGMVVAQDLSYVSSADDLPDEIPRAVRARLVALA